MRRLTYYLALLDIVVLVGTGGLQIGGVLQSAARAAGLPVLCAWILTLCYEKRVRKPNVFHVAFACFFAWNLLSLLWTVDQDATLDRCHFYLLYFGTAIIYWDLFRTRERCDGALQAFVIGLYMVVASTAYNAAHNDQALYDRFASDGYHPNTVAFLLGIGNPIAVYLGMNSRNKMVKAVNYVFPFFSVVGMILSGSRGGAIAAIPGFIFMLAMLWRANVWVKISIVVLAGLSIFALSQMDVSAQWDRITSAASSGEDDQYSGRTLLWAAAKDIFIKHPVLGVGGAGFPEESSHYDVPRSPMPGNSHLEAHNTYLELLSELGVIGFALFMWCFGCVFRDIWRLDGIRRKALLAAISSFPIVMFYEMIEWRHFTWLFFIFAVASRYCIDRPVQLPRAMARGISPVPAMHQSPL